MYQYLSENQKKYIFSSALAVLVVLALFIGVKFINSIKEFSYIGRGTYANNTISVTGKGEVMAVPDIATFTFSVEEQAKTVKDAQDKASKKVNDAISALKAMGVEEKDIKTEYYNSYPNYEYNTYPCVQEMSSTGSAVAGSAGMMYPCRQGKNVLIGYKVSQGVSVKIRNTEKAGDILTKIGSLNVSNLGGLSFVVDKLDDIKEQAKEKAIADAKDKAEKLAKALGVHLKKIITFYENGNVGMYGGDVMGAGEMMKSASVAVTPDLPAGENKITSNVSITYEIE